MRAWALRVWNDEEAFKALMRRIYGFGITAAGLVIPQLVNLGKVGWWGGLVVAALGANIPSKPIAPKP